MSVLQLPLPTESVLPYSVKEALYVVPDETADEVLLLEVVVEVTALVEVAFVVVVA